MKEPKDPAYAIYWGTILSVIKRRKYLGEKSVEELSVEDLQALKPLLLPGSVSIAGIGVDVPSPPLPPFFNPVPPKRATGREHGD